MGRTLQWHGDAWDEYCEWQQTDKATLKRINALIKDARRDPFTGALNSDEGNQKQRSGV